MKLNSQSLSTTIGDSQDGASNILLMLLIFILAGAFSSVAGSMGCVDSVVNLTLMALPPSFVLAGMFLAACIVSLSIGTSCGTIAALVPIAVGIADRTGSSVAMLTAIIVGGSFFGDNLSFISDTTIMATRTQGCKLSDKFRMNIRLALPAAILSLVLYVILGGSVSSAPEIGKVNPTRTLPYLIVFMTALSGMNVLLVLILGILSSALIGHFQGVLTPHDIWVKMWDGTEGMHDLIVVTIVAAVIIEWLQSRGIIGRVIQRILIVVHSTRAAELSISIAVVIVDFLTANNTIAILAVGPVAKRLSSHYHIDPRRTASLLDTMSCFAQGLVPWGAQQLIAAGLASVTPFDIIPYLYYPYILGVTTLLSIFRR